MTRAPDDLYILQGSTWETHWPILNDDGTAADLTGWSVRAQARRTPSEGAVLHQFDATIDGSDVVLKVSAAASTGWDWQSAKYDIELFRGAEVIRITQGQITVNPEVTRD